MLYFLKKYGGAIHCIVNGTRRYSHDIPQGGMEIPCLLCFSGDKKAVKMLSNLFKSSGRDKWHKKVRAMQAKIRIPLRK